MASNARADLPDLGPASVILLPQFVDQRGALTVAETGSSLPFRPERFFVLSDVPSGAERGAHANRENHELLVCVTGRFSVTVDRDGPAHSIVLADPTVAVHVPPLVWVRIHDASPGAVMVVAASHRYDPADAVRDRAEFLRLLEGH
jgi:UDP-2-acetamido-3-amino-2,3-dideoxy-glucuronate N-acetyltransferase